MSLRDELLAQLPIATADYQAMQADSNFCFFCNRVHPGLILNTETGMFEPEECEGDRR